MMKVFERLTSLTTAIAVVAMMSLGAATNAQAAELKILVVNQNAIFANSLAAKDRNKKLQAIFEAIKADADKEMEPLKQEAQNLQQQKALLGDEFNKKSLELQRKVQFTQYKYEQEQTVTEQTAQRLIYAQLYPIFNEIMQEKKGTMLLDQSQLIMVSPDFNITEDAIKRLDAKMPTVDIKRITWDEIVKAQQEMQQQMEAGKK